MNDSSSTPRIKVALDWFKGLKMDIPHSRWVMFSIGAYVLAKALAVVAEAISMLAPFFQ